MKIVKMLVPYLFAALLLVAVNAAASVIVNVDIPISGAVINPCNGETVTVSGVDHFTIHLTFDGAGGFHADSHSNIHITGTGSLGNSYEGNEEINNPFIAKVGFESTFGLTFSEISKGSAPNLEVHILQHITINPNGTVTVFFSNFTANCRG
jgi:hypothetical protein